MGVDVSRPERIHLYCTVESVSAYRLSSQHHDDDDGVDDDVRSRVHVDSASRRQSGARLET